MSAPKKPSRKRATVDYRQTSLFPSAEDTAPGIRMAKQVRDSARWLASEESSWKDRNPDTALPHPESNQHRLRSRPTSNSHPALYGNLNLSSDKDLRDAADSLAGIEPSSGVGTKPLEVKHLYRWYKHTPHAPVSMFLKYLVHRHNHLTEYDDPKRAHELDVSFRNLVQQGNASEKNGHVSIEDLHQWTGRHAPTLMPQLLDMRNKTQEAVRRGIGLSTRSINGEPYVALTRGLDSNIVSNEHPLASHADVPETGFGSVQHHAWVPVKDVWFSYDLGPGFSSGHMGPENEWLVSNTGTRYQAAPEDVKQNRVKGTFDNFLNAPHSAHEGVYDDATDAQLATSFRGLHGLKSGAISDIIAHKNAGPKVYRAVFESYANPLNVPATWYQYAWVPREQALAQAKLQGGDTLTQQAFALRNPNLTPDDLASVAPYVLRPTVWDSDAKHLVDRWANAPQMNSKVLEQVYRQTKSPEVRQRLLASPLAPVGIIQEEVSNLQSGVYPLGSEPGFRIAEAVSDNPHHTPQQADQVYNWIKRSASDEAPAANVWKSKAALSLTRNLNLSESAARDMAQTAAAHRATVKSDVLSVEGKYADDALMNYAEENPHAGSVLSKLAAENLVPADYLALRLGRRGYLEPELQSAYLRLEDGPDLDSSLAYRELAGSKGLTQETINTIAHSKHVTAREELFRNKTITPEQIREAFPKEQAFPEPSSHAVERASRVHPDKFSPAGIAVTSDPFVTAERGDVAGQIADAYYRRKAWEDRLAREHLIKPLPANLAKSEDDFWQAQAREWLAQQKNTSFLYPTTQERAVNIIRDGAIEPELTDELLHGEAVFAHPDSPTICDAWRKTAGPEDVMLRFETEVEPERHHDGRFFWTHRIPVANAQIVDAGEQELAKSHPPLTFPKLGVGDDRRETKIVANPLQRRTFVRAAAVQAVRENVVGKESVEHAKVDPAYRESLANKTYKRYQQNLGFGVTFEGVAGVGHPGHGQTRENRMFDERAGTGQSAMSAVFMPQSYSSAKKFGPLSQAAQNSPEYIQSTSTHENLHRIFGRVQHLHGTIARDTLAQNLMFALPKDLSDAVWQHLHNRRPDYLSGKAFGNASEEALTELSSYLTLPTQREQFHTNRQDPPSKQQEFHDKMKRAYKLLQAIAPTVDKRWLTRTRPWLKKGEAAVPFHEVQSTGLSAQQAHEVFKRSQKLSKAQPELMDPNLFAFEYECDLELQRAIADRHLEVELRKAAYVEDEELKSLYRQGAKQFHPDLAVDDADRARRTATLQHLNAAYAARDIHKVRSIIGVPASEGAASPVSLRGSRIYTSAGPMRKSEAPVMSIEGVFGPGEESAARLMLGHRPEQERALAAARFLTGRKVEVDESKFRLAMSMYDGDFERAALLAVGLTDSEKNLKALRAAIELGEFSPDHLRELSKNEPGTPHIESVQPAAADAQETAESVSRAVSAGLVQPLVLGGKHSKGAMAARDPRGHIWLLKPGSGKMAPTKGARDDSCSQSAREAAFWHCADKVGMGNYYPRCDLLLVNGAEVAAMKLLGTQWLTLDERNRKVDGYAREVLGPYLQRGDVHRLAFLDGVLGNSDSHGQNWMAHAEAVAGIDHGSAFAGPGFDPGHDTKSYTPYVLRVFGMVGYSKAPPEERVKSLPVLDRETDAAFRKWVRAIDPAMLVEAMSQHGIGEVAQKAVVVRLDHLQRYDGPSLSAQLNAQWAGVEPWQ